MTESVFDGLRVVEIGRGEAARYCSMLFADFGATVVQLVDSNERWQPHSGLAVDYFGRMLDRGKYTSSPPQDDAQYLATVRAWLAEADILIDGSVRGGLPAAGLSYEEIRKERPELVIIALSL